MAKEKDSKKTKEKEEPKAELVISESLAVKYRPQSFRDVVGQSKILTQLKGAIKSKKIPSTILFHGPAGCGKTTLARLFAMYLNCATNNLCGTCPSCMQGIDSHQDITEINMASATGKAEAENLVKMAKYSPRFKIRVFILDEYHQVSAAAEQTFLKPLEEPPPNTIWILCTTNPEKFKTATLTRCLKLQVTTPSPEELCERLMQISSKEGLDLSDKRGKSLCMTIANYSNGHVRDAISILESVLLSHAGSKKSDLAKVVEDFAATLESTTEKAAARCMVAYLKKNLKTICIQSSQVSDSRQLLSALRWLCMTILDDYAGTIKWKTYAFDDFKSMIKAAEIKYDFKAIVPSVIELLTVLNEIETKMYLTNIDIRVLFTTGMCNHIMELKQRD
jgi:DNA polymerase III subunit gamma/tau